jgi:uncharacterized membrane protein
MTTISPSTISFGAPLASLAMIVGYHAYLHARLRRDPSYTIQAINSSAREAWVHSIMGVPGKDILAVQTLRNSTMAATFLASTAILLIMGALNLLQKSDLGSLLSSLSRGPVEGTLGEVKLLALLVDFFWAFFCFSQAVRMYNHVGYLINAGSGRRFGSSPDYVARLLNRSGGYYSLGMRSYYISVPLVFWLFGPFYLVMSSVGLVMVLYHIDRSPEVSARKASHSEAAVPPSPIGEAVRVRAEQRTNTADLSPVKELNAA